MNWPLLGVVIGIVLGLTVFNRSHGRDLGQWENSPPETRAWFKSLMMPDNPVSSCCGEADAYYCDDLGTDKGGNYCNITDERDDQVLHRPHIDIGTKIYIPDHKVKWGPNDAQPRTDWTTGQPVSLNPTNHAIVFLSREKFVYCFVPGVLM